MRLTDPVLWDHGKRNTNAGAYGLERQDLVEERVIFSRANFHLLVEGVS